MEEGPHSSCGPQILAHPAADGRVKGSTAIHCCKRTRGFRIFRYFGKLIKLMNSVSIKKISVEFFSVQNVAVLAKHKILNNVLSAGANNFAGLSYLLIYSISYFVVDDLESS